MLVHRRLYSSFNFTACATRMFHHIGWHKMITILDMHMLFGMHSPTFYVHTVMGNIKWGWSTVTMWENTLPSLTHEQHRLSSPQPSHFVTVVVGHLSLYCRCSLRQIMCPGRSFCRVSYTNANASEIHQQVWCDEKSCQSLSLLYRHYTCNRVRRISMHCIAILCSRRHTGKRDRHSGGGEPITRVFSSIAHVEAESIGIVMLGITRTGICSA